MEKDNDNPLSFVTKFFVDSTVRWDAERCAMLLGLAVGRIRLQRKKYREINENRKREVAALLQQEKEMQARVKAMAVIHEDYLAEVRDIVELYCERLVLRVDVMNVQKYIPVDCAELVNGVVYAATFMENSPELSKLREMFIAKYGPIHVDAVERGCVEDRILDRLSRAPPSNVLVDYYLGTIAMQFEIDWSPPEVQIKEEKGGKEPARANPPPDLLLPTPQLKKEEAKKPIEKEKPKVEAFDVKGEVRADDNGNFWVFQLGFAAGEPPFFIPKTAALNSQNGNYVGVALDKRADGKRSGKIVAILGEKAPRFLHGVLLRDLKGNHWVKTDSQVLVFVAPKDLHGGVVNSEVLVQLHERSDGKLSGAIVEKPKEAERTLDGVLQVGSQGHNWVISSVIAEPIFIAPTDLNGARHESRVTVALHNRADGKFSGVITSVIDPTQAVKSMLHDDVPMKPHKKDQRRGEIFEDVNGHHWLINEGGNNPFSLGGEPAVYIPREFLNGATSGDKVEVDVSPSPYALNSFVGQVSKITHKSASRATQVLGVLSIEPESGEGLVRNRENGSNVYIACDDLSKFNDSQRGRSREADAAAVPGFGTAIAETGDLVLVDAVETPNGHPKRGTATHIGTLSQVVDKASLEFTSTLHLSPSPHNPKLTVAFVDHPSDPSQRVIIEYEDLQGATDGSTVRVCMSRQFQNAQQKAVGKIVQVVKLASTPSISSSSTSSTTDAAGAEGDEYVDEFEALSAEWNRRKSKPTSPSATPKARLSQQLKPFADVFVPLKSSEINFNDYLPPVVITCGSLNLRCGLSYDLENDALSQRPSIVDPLIVGRPLTSKFKMQTIGDGTMKETLVGDECSRRFGVLVLSRPVVNGVVVNWEDFEIALRHHFITTLQVDITRHPVIISTGSRNSDGLSSNQSDTANILKLILSRFNAPLVSLQPEWKLISYAAGEQTALIVSLGDSVSYVAPIVNGKEIVFATKLLPVNGSMATERLIKLLGDANVGRFESMSEQNAIRLLKEKHAFVRDVLVENEEVSYEMPDGSTISVPLSILADCVEVLFDPSLAGLEKGAGVVDAAFASVLAVENAELRKSLLQNIIICGGSGEIKQFGSRFIRNLQALLATNEATLELEAKLRYPKNDEESKECGNLVWRGACEFAAHNKECLWMRSK